MSTIHPAWAEHQQPKSPATRRIEQRRAEEEQAARDRELKAFYAEHLQLRRQLAALKFDLALRRIFRKYSPDQPRDELGRWTSGGNSGRNDPRVISDAAPDNNAIPGAQYAQGRTRGPVTVRIGGRTFEVEGGQAARLVEAQTRAEGAIARVRELDPNWRPAPSTYESVEGLIRTHEAEAREAQARASELAKVGIGPGPFAGESIPARGPERDFTAAEHREINRIGTESGCNTCGTKNPGTPLGNFVVDHQPPSALNLSGRSQFLYPQCASCSALQGGWARSLTRTK